MTTVEPGSAQAARRALLEQRIAQAARRAAEGADVAQASDVAEVVADAEPGTKDRPTPLAVAQRPLWWFAQLRPDLPLYNEIVHFTKTGPLVVNALEQALNDLVSRHEAWRTTYEARDGEPVQIVHPVMTFKIPLIDLSELGLDTAKKVALTHAVELAQPAYDLASGPLLRPLLIRLAPDEHRLYLAMHHLIFDGVTLYRIVLPELVALYDARVEGVTAALPPAPRYRDFVAWEESELAGPRFTDNVDFHRRRLAGSAPMNLPVDRPRPSRPSYQGALESLRIPAPVARRLRAIADESSVTLFQVLAAAYSLLLARFVGQEEVVFGTATDLRRRRDLVSLVGMCVSSSVLRVGLDGDPRFVDLVERVRDELADVLDRHVPFDVLVRELQSSRDQRIHPLFQVEFVLEPPMPPIDPAWSLAQIEVELGDALQVAKFDLHLELDERLDGHLSGRFIFNTDLFDRSTVQRMGQAFELILESIALDPRRPISELAVLSEAQQQEMLVDWNDTAPKASDDVSALGAVGAAQTLTDALERQASTTPDAIAASFEGATLTYRELHESANALAERLIAAGAGPGNLVGICADRSLEMLVGMLAVLKSGAGYVPMDPALPPSRLQYMVQDAAPAALLLDDAMLDRAGTIADLSAPAPAIVELAGCLDDRSGKPPTATRPTRPEDAACVIYTSGSTGRPKGVLVPHGGIVNVLAGYQTGPGFPRGSRILALATISFDIAMGEIWLPLVTGERCTLASRADAIDPAQLVALLRREKITILQGTPSTFQALVDHGWQGSPDLTVFTMGEPLSRALGDDLISRSKEVWNLYGPTETTVFSTAWRVVAGETITVGRPIRNTRAYILDALGRPVPVGVAGELTIGGSGVTTGYLNRPELTAERFVPELHHPGERMYRTGDLARFCGDGRIELFGRLDHQVKIRGHRVELGEIESAILQQSSASAAVVVVRELSPGDQRLVAYVVPGVGAEEVPATDWLALRSALKATLPSYMIPTAFVSLESLRLTASGKVDRGALPAPAAGDLARATSAVIGETPLERQLERIWARVLGVDSVGPEEDFFELGGHSLLAVRLVAAIEGELGVSMTISMLINGDVTVRGLAARLDAAGTEQTGKTAKPAKTALSSAHDRDGKAPEVVRFNAGGTQAPLIMFFPSRESLLAMRHLQSTFDADQPVIGVLAGLDQSARFPRESTVAQIARESLETVRELQPTGVAYRIAGYSLAGLIAYEVAGLLIGEGAEVEWLGLIDTYSPQQAARELSVRLYLERSLTRNWRESVRSAARKVRTESIVVGVDLAARARKRPLDRFDELGARRLMHGYSPPGHTLALDLFVTEDSSERAAPMLGWSDLHQGQLRVHHLAGDHMSIMQGDSARRLGQFLSETMATAVS